MYTYPCQIYDMYGLTAFDLINFWFLSQVEHDNDDFLSCFVPINQFATIILFNLSIDISQIQKNEMWKTGLWWEIPYIRLLTRHVLSANSSLKSCIKSTRVNFSRNPSESFKIYFICMIVSNLRDWIFHDFDTLGNSGKWMHAEKTWCTVFRMTRYLWFSLKFSCWQIEVSLEYFLHRQLDLHAHGKHDQKEFSRQWIKGYGVCSNALSNAS